MRIRSIAPADHQAWIKLRIALWPDQPDLVQAEAEEYLAGTSKIMAEVLLAEDSGGEMIGFIELNIRTYAPGSNEREVPFVEGWYVDDAYRGRGIGKLLMQAAEHWAADKGYRELASDAQADNLQSIAAHKTLGFKEVERVVCFIKSLG